MFSEKTVKQLTGRKRYLITLYHLRSVIALAAGILVLCLTFIAIVQGLRSWGNETEDIFHYFTVLSNMFSAVGAAFMIPYAVEGIRRKRFVLPKWIVMFQYGGAVGVAITMTTTLLFILPVQGRSAITGMNFWLHLITPLLTISLFECVETGILFTRKEMLSGLIPYWCYMLVYFIMVIVIGEKNGGWKDIYYTQAFWPVWVSFIMMLALGFFEAAMLRWIHDRRAKQSRKRLTRLWNDEMDPVALKIEAFGLGRYMGAHCDANSVIVPLDIFYMMAKRYDVPEYELAKAFIKGVCDELGEKYELDDDEKQIHN